MIVAPEVEGLNCLRWTCRNHMCAVFLFWEVELWHVLAGGEGGGFFQGRG
jgi:hypothetical protein